MTGHIGDFGIAHGLQQQRIALRHGDGSRAGAQRQARRDAAAELSDENRRRALHHIGQIHRQKAVIGGLLRGQRLYDSDWPVAVDEHAEVGIDGHAGQADRRHIGKAGGEMEVRAAIYLDVAERTRRLVDALGIGEVASVADTLVLRADDLGQREIERGRREAGNHQQDERRAIALHEEPGQPAQEPEAHRQQKQSLRRQQIEGAQERETAQSGSGQIGKIDASEMALPAQEGEAEEHGAGQEWRKIQ